MADWVATVALGVLLNNLGEVTRDMGMHRVLNVDTELAAFWAPFLLLHLGGPDTVTAYALEDNELWLRHFLGLGVQTGVAVYIFFMAWRGSLISILTMPMFLAGIIKYGERTWALRSASNEQLRDSMLTPPDAGPNYSKFMEEFTLKQYEGFHVTADEVIEAQAQVDVSQMGTASVRDDTELLQAHYSFKTFKRLFVDLILSFQDRDNSQNLFKDMSFENAFKVIEIELGFMFDVLYTKGAIIHARVGCYLRFISLSSTVIVLILFSFAHEKNHSKKIDLAVTFSLLVVAIFLELCAILLLISSDWTDIYLTKHSKIRKFIAPFQLPKHRRWSNSLAQHSLLSFCLKSKPIVSLKIQNFFGIDKILEKHLHKTIDKVSDDLKKLVFTHLKEKFRLMMSILSGEAEAESNRYESELKALCICRGDRALQNSDFFDYLSWSVEVEFDQSILIWHIATDLCYHSDPDETEKEDNRKISQKLSQYMLYLLVMRPFMLPMGIGKIRYLDTCKEVRNFFEERESVLGDFQTSKGRSLNSWLSAINPFSKGKSKLDESKACEVLLNVNTQVPPIKVKGDRSKSVLFDACKLASQLQDISDREGKWNLVCNVWVEMLAYAASRCKGNYHAQQLRQGGELLTHVWLLMAHFGLTEQFQISHGHARAKLSVR
ncbi:unnamed protein product [Dovyalis caffra]|uniref:DUF4220 domain-containing protein n=1 Tax=Dovyalis caffra TaxID=77055 RepID=A0AAV1QRT6_9ROSI|nr:unnamed protein product [Dovyalis caffra]